jgi:DNA-binding NarL/FixJ family response regulator
MINESKISISKVKELTVLIADDDDTTRTNIRLILNHQKDVTVVGEVLNGADAINQARLLKPDLILMNIEILKTTGPEIVRVIKTVSSRTEISFITIHDESIYRDLTELMHVDGFIAKQSLNKELPRVLEKLIKIKNDI